MTRKSLYIFLMILQVLFAGACGKDVEGQQQGQNGGLVNPLPPGEEFTITVATCNVLKPKGRRDEMSMDEQVVRKALANSIMETKADIIGFNELDETHISGGRYSLPAACALLRDYKWEIEWPNKIQSGVSVATYSYANGFAYNSAKIKLEECGYVWLSKEDNAWYNKAESAYKHCGSPERTCVWARMTHIASNKEFWLFVTHLPTSSQGGAYNMAKVVNNFAAHKAGSAPAILTGDMNSAPGSDAYRALTSYWKDGNSAATWGTLSGSSTSYYYPVDVFTSDRTDRRIDHIMTRGFTATDYQTIVVTYNVDGTAWCPSDHLPVKATIST